MDTLFIQNTAEKEKINVVYVKTGTKLFTQNVYFAHFLEGHLSALHSRLAKESQIFRKPFKIIVSSTLKMFKGSRVILCFEEPCISNILLNAPSCGLRREDKSFSPNYI